ncbi:MAG: phosphatidylcholine/phosphatidylserine synthase [Gordonia sp. (in: high G+C Gram-positive bacteria)]
MTEPRPRRLRGRRVSRRSSGPIAGRRRPARPAPEDVVEHRARRSGRMFLPSALTILAICASLTAMRFADAGEVDLALGLLVVAAVLDGLDGRVARMMDATSKIGAELDSLADAINFGVVPAMIVYAVLLRDQPSMNEGVGWVFALVFCSAIVLRLARFNTLLDDEDAPGYTRDFFVGVPAPAAAITALLPVALLEQFGPGWWTSTPAVASWLAFVALLAVSRVPTFSFKSAKIQPHYLAAVMIVFAAAAALAFTFPYVLMVAAIAGYLLHIPFAWRSRQWVVSRPEHWDNAPREWRQQRRSDRRANPNRKSLSRLGLRRPGRPAEGDL